MPGKRGDKKLNREQFNNFCRALPKSTHVVQWGNADVWKIGGKIFAIGSRWGVDSSQLDVKISFKCSDFSYQLLTQETGIIPAPYLARAKWVQLEEKCVFDDLEIGSYIQGAYDIIVGKLTKAVRKDLNL